MFPIHDDIPSKSFPYVNVAIILLCSIAFFFQLQTVDGDGLVERLGMIPARVLDPARSIEIVRQIPVQTPLGVQLLEQSHVAAPSAVPPWLTMLTCIFLHGGWMHIIGNLWFLYIFGDNVEDRLGHLGYLLFYLASGVGASAIHLLVNSQSSAPTIGASGAIAGVMGAYLVLYPRANVVAIVPLFIFLQPFLLPAPVFLVIWFLMQFLQGTMSITASEVTGVAWWAHIGGFAIGVLCGAMFRGDGSPESPRGRSAGEEM